MVLVKVLVSITVTIMLTVFVTVTKKTNSYARNSTKKQTFYLNKVNRGNSVRQNPILEYEYS